MASRAKITVSYLGGGYHGWQRQRAQPTVQEELERTLQRLTGGGPIAVVGAGRTDTGVHAAGQVAHADLPSEIPADGLLKALNQALPRDIRARRVRQVHPGFHARRDACAKWYAYRARWNGPALPWLDLRAAIVPPIVDGQAFDAAARALQGTRDMASFTVPEVAERSTVRSLYRVRWRSTDRGIDIHFVGDGFLRYQVRRMVGALLAVGRSKLSLGDFLGMLDDPRPGSPIETAPAGGLTLEKVYYRSVPGLGF